MPRDFVEDFCGIKCGKPGNGSATVTVEGLKRYWLEIRKHIESQLACYKSVWETGTDEDIFRELCFCLLTPQSKAVSCWDAVKTLSRKKLILSGTKTVLASNIIKKARFHNNKAGYIVEARKLFQKDGKLAVRDILSQFKTAKEKREWLVKNVKGMGYKEAGHFLRNIGFGSEITILDRHILKNLRNLGIIKSIPKTLTKARYFEIEEKMAGFSKKSNIPLDHMDIILWCKETGEIFK